MKGSLYLTVGLAILAGLFAVSCEVSTDSDTHETTLKYTQDDEAQDVSSGARYYANVNGGYTLSSDVNDTTTIYVSVPELKEGTWTMADNEDNASVMIIYDGQTSNIYSTSVSDTLTDYYIAIDSYSGGGWIYGTFEAKIGSFLNFFGSEDYITITNGQFDLTTE